MAQQRTRNITSADNLVDLLKECEPSFEYPEGMGGITEDLYHKGRGTNFEPNLIRSSEVLEVYKGLPEHVRVNLWQLVDILSTDGLRRGVAKVCRLVEDGYYSRRVGVI